MLEKNKEKTNELHNVYNLSQRLTNIQSVPKINAEEFFNHCIIKYYSPEKEQKFIHPNGWFVNATFLDKINPVNEKYKSPTVIKVSFGNNSTGREFPDNLYKDNTSAFWDYSKLKYFNLNACYFSELEELFKWFNETTPSDTKHLGFWGFKCCDDNSYFTPILIIN
jgi:hypothetical protein